MNGKENVTVRSPEEPMQQLVTVRAILLEAPNGYLTNRAMMTALLSVLEADGGPAQGRYKKAEETLITVKTWLKDQVPPDRQAAEWGREQFTSPNPLPVLYGMARNVQNHGMQPGWGGIWVLPTARLPETAEFVPLMDGQEMEEATRKAVWLHLTQKPQEVSRLHELVLKELGFPKNRDTLMRTLQRLAQGSIEEDSSYWRVKLETKVRPRSERQPTESSQAKFAWKVEVGDQTAHEMVNVAAQSSASTPSQDNVEGKSSHTIDYSYYDRDGNLVGPHSAKSAAPVAADVLPKPGYERDTVFVDGRPVHKLIDEETSSRDVIYNFLVRRNNRQPIEELDREIAANIAALQADREWLRALPTYEKILAEPLVEVTEEDNDSQRKRNEQLGHKQRARESLLNFIRFRYSDAETRSFGLGVW